MAKFWHAVLRGTKWVVEELDTHEYLQTVDETAVSNAGYPKKAQAQNVADRRNRNNYYPKK